MASKREYSLGVVILLLLVVIVALVAYIEREEKSEEVVEQITAEIETPRDTTRIILKNFDPNTVELRELLAMGLTKYQALSLLRYRASGKVFSIKEELISCYGFSDSLYFALEPYITIGEQFRYKKREAYKPKEYTPKRVYDNTPRYETRKPKVDTTQKKLAPQPKPLVDLNLADSATLRSVSGIGEKSVVAIMQYREKLGGFYSAKQLLELNVVLDKNYEKIITQILVDSCDISKIDVNFALANELGSHPYIAPKLRRLLFKRELKGGWSSIEEMIDDKIFSRQEAQRVRPYLRFELPDLR